MKDIPFDMLTETEKEVSKVVNERWILGRRRYKSQGLTHLDSPNPLDWIKEAVEECADQLQYLVALKLCLEKGKKK